MSSPYRDSFEAQRDRLRSLDRLVSELETSFTDFFWSRVASGLGLAQPSDLGVEHDEGDVKEITRAVADREARLTSLQRVTADYQRIESAWKTPALEVPPCPRRGHLHIQSYVLEKFIGNHCLDTFERHIKDIEYDAVIKELGPYERDVSLTYNGTPFRVLCDTYTDSHKSSGWAVDISVQTSVSFLSGELQLSPQGFGSEILIAVRLQRDIKIGHPDFDGIFIIKGEEKAAEAMLTQKVRKNLRVISECDIPKLIVKNGLARVTWSYDPTIQCLEAAMKALRGIRRAPATKMLRR